jgi:hypothetical protein
MNTVNRNPLFRFFFSCLLFLSCILLLAGCPTSAEDDNSGDGDDGYEEDLVVTEEDGSTSYSFSVADRKTRFFSLSTGEEVTDEAAIKSPAWDIAFEGTRLIYTNSGASAGAYNSGGFGGIWHTNSKDFAAVEPDDLIDDDPVYTPYHQDVKRWEMNMSGTYERRLNVMTYKGYGTETATGNNGLTQGSAFGLGYAYDKQQFYINPPLPNGSLRMPPDFQITNWVYIIRHGNGAQYSKLQITRFVRDFSETVVEYKPEYEGIDRYTIKWKTFDEE